MRSPAGGTRTFTKSGVGLDAESPLRPALGWYTGQPYATPGFRTLLTDAMARGLHCLIISGGYGVLRPEEPIHSYAAHLPSQTRSVWERRLRAILPDYVARTGIRRVFVALSKSYADCLPASLGVEEEWRSIPTFDPTRDRGAAMRVVPERVGSSVSALLANELLPGLDWAPPEPER